MVYQVKDTVSIKINGEIICYAVKIENYSFWPSFVTEKLTSDEVMPGVKKKFRGIAMRNNCSQLWIFQI